MKVMSMRAVVGVGVALLLATATACGSGDDEPGVASAGGLPVAGVTSPTAAGDRDAALRDFAQCMRDNGVDLPDPEPGSGMLEAYGGLLRGEDPVVREAFAACRSRLPNGGEPPKLDPERLENYRAFAGCMRDNGVSLPDPAPDGSLQLSLMGGLNPSDPVFQAAVEACQDHLAGLLPNGGRR
ncbi:MAG: hypothetical protein IRY85_13405 [Micromonosporaceae bacterium]|nr:hypothetical protein [Micromonosporaceae bacterium]